MVKRTILFLLATVFIVAGSFAQTQIKGTVLFDEDNEPVIGASVVIQGTTTGVQTNIDGQFTLAVDAGKNLVVSYIGMETQVVKARNGMTVRLRSKDAVMEEVVVTGMQKMDKRLFTGASTKLNAAETKLDGVADVSRALEGRAAGVSVQNVSGTFGSAPKIRVRGATSIYGS